MRPRVEHTMRNILRTVAVVVIFLTGYFYIFGKSNEGCAAEAKSPPIRQELVHDARKQIPLARAAHAATYACHEVTSDCDFSRDLRNTERCHNAERIVKHLGVI